jgi:hypothetical protein
MAEELIVEQAAKEVINEVAETTSTLPGKMTLVVGGVLVGVAVGYYFARKQLAAKYNQMAEDEIAEMRAHYLAKEVASDEKKTLDELMIEHGYKAKLEGPDETTYVKIEPEVEPAEEPEEKNVFVNEDNWDYESELQNRTGDVPYVIHRDEFIQNENDWQQVTFTYFEGDDVLAGDSNTPIDDQDAMIGLGNLAKFGHGSGDPNIVYIRNVELELEIEVVHSDGEYTEEIHGIPNDELSHSDRRKRRQRDN